MCSRGVKARRIVSTRAVAESHIQLTDACAIDDGRRRGQFGDVIKLVSQDGNSFVAGYAMVNRHTDVSVPAGTGGESSYADDPDSQRLPALNVDDEVRGFDAHDEMTKRL